MSHRVLCVQQLLLFRKKRNTEETGVLLSGLCFEYLQFFQLLGVRKF